MESSFFASSTVTILHPKESNFYREASETALRLGLRSRHLSYDLGARFPSQAQSESENTELITTGVPESKAAMVRIVFEAKLGKFVSLIDPTSAVASTAEIGCGVHVDSLSAVASEAKLMCHSRLNRSSSVGHDTQIGSFVYIGPGATVCGLVEIGYGAVIGAGAIVLPSLKIGENSFVGAGAVVTRDVPANAVVYGNPARVMRLQDSWNAITKCPACE